MEWLINEIEVELGIRIESTRMGCEIVQQAKAMHKEETLKLYYAYEDYVLREEGIIKTFGQFYNETFNQ